VQTFTDPRSPRHQLPLEQLPRGVVKFPPHIVEAVARDKSKFGPQVFTEEYAQSALERQTLIWYYQGLPVLYRSVADGIEVLAVGWQETAKYSPSPTEPDVKLVQP
jgi:hypothetical protein